MDGITELAGLFRQRDNKEYFGPQIGVVKSPPPNIQVSLGDKIILNKSHLIIASQVLSGYQREVEIDGDSTNAESGSLTINNTSQTLNSSNTIGITNIKGTMTYKDTLKANDEVILIPTADNQKYFLIDKAVRL